MLTITLISVSHKQPDWVVQAFTEYVKRLPARELKLDFKELKPEAREGKSLEQAMRLEADKIRAAIPKNALVLALDERGQAVTSMDLAQKLQYWQSEYAQVAFIIGGADGLSPEFKDECDGLLRLSHLTLPHGMVRVLFAEQIYRAFAINHNHPYHRA